MNRDDVIRMALKAGMEQDGDNFFSPSHEEIDVHITDLERFASIVAAAAIHDDLLWQAETETAVLGEREACAKVCEDLLAWDLDDPGSTAAAAIRARKENT